jgi:hypothetical protein
LHEILHAIDDHAGHRIFDNNEKALVGICEGLLQVLSENRSILDLIYKQYHKKDRERDDEKPDAE